MWRNGIAAIEPRWQAFWDQHETFKAELDLSRPKYYVLDTSWRSMLPGDQSFRYSRIILKIAHGLHRSRWYLLSGDPTVFE